VPAGKLCVVLGSHAFGRLDRVRTEGLRKERGEIVVPVARGGALVMRPMTARIIESNRANGQEGAPLRFRAGESAVGFRVARGSLVMDGYMDRCKSKGLA
jgi:hypothetical protein